MKNFVLAVSLLCCALPLAAQTASSRVPSVVKYSGTAADINNKPLTGAVGITFMLYKDQTGGAPLWIETQNVQADKNGHYSAVLGSATPQGLPAEAFAAGEARWLGVQPSGQPEQSRTLLVSVPYALKALDADTIGGKPASAFMLAAPIVAGSQASGDAAATQGIVAPATAVTTTGGTVNALPLWTTGSNIQSSALTQTGTGATAKIGIGTTTPTTTLDVKGAETVRGALTLPATAAATATAGTNSQPENQVASSFSSATKAAVNQTFQWLAEPALNNTANPSGTLNLRYGLGTTVPSETGLKLSNKGIFTFALGQTFPGAGAGTVTSVGLSAPASDFSVTGSPITTAGTLGLNWNVPPTSANTPNAIVKRDANGSFSASTVSALAVSAINVGSGGDGVLGIATNGYGVVGEDTSGGDGVLGVSSSGYGVYGSSTSADGVHGASNSSGSGVAGINTAPNGTGVYGSAPGWAFTANGNTYQDRTSGGWVKAMVFVHPNNGIVMCFNFMLAGAAATTPPCGFGFDKTGVGDYIIDFGFQVDDRFFSITNVYPLESLNACTDIVARCNNITTPNQVEVSSYTLPGFNFSDAKFYLVVY